MTLKSGVRLHHHDYDSEFIYEFMLMKLYMNS